MKNVVIFEDGKILRGSKAKLIRRGNKRVLIEFIKYDVKIDKDVLVTEWFKVFQPSWKKHPKYNNKRKNVLYPHEESNEFYNDYTQTDKFKQRFKEDVGIEHYNELYGEQ